MDVVLGSWVWFLLYHHHCDNWMMSWLAGYGSYYNSNDADVDGDAHSDDGDSVDSGDDGESVDGGDCF